MRSLSRSARAGLLVASLVGLCIARAEDKAAASSPVNPTGTPVRPAVSPAIDKGELLGHIQYLASPELGGREAGSPDEKLAAAYIAGEFKRFGLEPAGTLKNGQREFLQEFSILRVTGSGPKSALKWIEGEKTFQFSAASNDFAPLALHGTCLSATGGVVFAGYGICAPELDYDDFKGVDLASKWALVLRYEPQEFDPKSKFSGKEYTSHAALAQKVRACADRKAVGVLIVAGPAGRPKAERPKLSETRGMATETVNVPVFEIGLQAADTILAAAQKNIAGLQEAIDKDLSNQSFALPSGQLEGTADVQAQRILLANVVARLPGRDEALREETLVVGAHYDHLGRGAAGSLDGKEGKGKVHPGAEDNASGVAAMLEIAQALAALPPAERPPRSVHFVAFTGEEKGLWGSAYYVQNPAVPMEQTVGMINLDMVGRPRNGAFGIAGVATGKGLKPIIEQALTPDLAPLARLTPSLSGGSDHLHFHRRKVPVLFFLTAIDPDYHRTTDTWDKIDGPGAERVARAACAVARAWASAPARVEFSLAPSGGYLGVAPDPKKPPMGAGFGVGNVVKGSAAEAAGLKIGDAIVSIAGREVANVSDLPLLLMDFAPGDEVAIGVRRGEELLTLQATLRRHPSAETRK